jgi:hypothetical protein
MPYIIQYTRHLHDRVAALETRSSPKKTEDQHAAEAHAAAAAVMGGSMMGMGETLMLTAGPAFGDYGGGYGAPYGQPAYGQSFGQPAYGQQPGFGGGFY